MKKMERAIEKEDLMVILNELERQEIDHISIEEPYFGNKILDIDITGKKYRVGLHGKNDFETPASKDDYWDRDEIPGFYEYKECLISAGLIKFDNWDEFKDWVEYLYKSEVDPTVASKSVFLSIDTNMAYYRLISRRFPLEIDGTTIKANDFDYLLSSIVEGEIDHHIRDKYDSSDLKMMGMYTDIGDLRFNFRNRGKLETRKAKFATQELNYLRGELNAARVKGNESKVDSEKNDIRIVESLENFAWTKNIVTALISSDRNMGNHAENSEIPYFVLEMPSSIPRENEVGADIILNILHDIALFFGAVKIPELSTTLFGIWGGKRDEDYKNESVKAWINPGADIVDEVKRDLDVIESLTGPD